MAEVGGHLNGTVGSIDSQHAFEGVRSLIKGYGISSSQSLFGLQKEFTGVLRINLDQFTCQCRIASRNTERCNIEGRQDTLFRLLIRICFRAWLGQGAAIGVALHSSQ